MIRFEHTESNFKLYYKDYLFLHHSRQNSCFVMGKGNATYKMRHGHFKIKEKELEEIPLQEFKLISKTDTSIKLEFTAQGNTLNVSFYDIGGHFIIGFECLDSEINRLRIRIPATQTEAIYGCGEQFSEVNLRGKNVPLWVEEQGVGRGDPPITGDWYTTYYPQPTFVSSNNYFCHCGSSSYAKFNFTQEDIHELYIWSIPKNIIFGKYDTALDTISNLSELLGRQPELPDWVYDGVWLGIQGGKQIVDEKIQKCLDNNVRIAAVWCQDWQGIHMQGQQKRLIWNWEYDEDLYPDLPSYIKELNEKGIKFLGYNNSMLAKGEKQYFEAIDKDLCVKDETGNSYKLITDSGEKVILDLSNEKTIEWLKAIIKENMLSIGLSGWMADYGEYLPIDGVLSSGEHPEIFHNKYPVIFAKLNLEAVEEAGKLNEIVFFTRAGYSGVSKYTTMVWAGDQLVNWSLHDGLASVIPAGISLGICGIGYFHYDIGGFHSLNQIYRTKENFMRWTELAAFTMTMRTHESIKPYDNLQFDSDEEIIKHFGRMSRIYVHLKPYYKSLSEEYLLHGIPPIRACYLHYEDDPELHHIKYQYLLGRDLLIAPVIKPNLTSWEVYLPDDKWIHLWSGKEYQKGWIEIEAQIGQPPVFYLKSSKNKQLFEELKSI